MPLNETRATTLLILYPPWHLLSESCLRQKFLFQLFFITNSCTASNVSCKWHIAINWTSVLGTVHLVWLSFHPIHLQKWPPLQIHPQIKMGRRNPLYWRHF